MSTMGDRIRDKRLELGLSVDDVAKRLGKNRATVYRYESDYIENLPLSVIPPLAEVLKVTPAYLMGWGEDEGKKDLPATQSEEAMLDQSLITKLLTLTPEEQEKVVAFVQGLIAARPGPTSPEE